MNLESTLRVGTKITYFFAESNKAFRFQEVCLIYEDPVNKGYYIALSQPTSKAGWGQSQEEAYINLVISVVCAIRHGLKEDRAPQFVESNDPVWSNLPYIHRMAADKQIKLLKKASQMLPKCTYEDIGSEKGKSTLVERQEQGTTILGISSASVIGCEDTAYSGI